MIGHIYMDGAMSGEVESYIHMYIDIPAREATIMIAEIDSRWYVRDCTLNSSWDVTSDPTIRAIDSMVSI